MPWAPMNLDVTTGIADRLRTLGRQALAMRPRWDLRRLAKRLVLPFRQYLGRTTIADRHIRGSGIEIGAMQDPLPVRSGVKVRYVDWLDTKACAACNRTRTVATSSRCTSSTTASGSQRSATARRDS